MPGTHSSRTIQNQTRLSFWVSHRQKFLEKRRTAQIAVRTIPFSIFCFCFCFCIKLVESSVHVLVFIYGKMLPQIFKNSTLDVKGELFKAIILCCSNKYLYSHFSVLDTVSWKYLTDTFNINLISYFNISLYIILEILLLTSVGAMNFCVLRKSQLQKHIHSCYILKLPVTH